MATRTPSQQIAELEARIARIKSRDRALENGQKIILGGLLLQAARTDPKIRTWLITTADKAITRDIDRKRIDPLLAELRSLSTSAADPQPTTPAADPQPTTPAADPQPTTPAADPQPTTPAADSQPTTPAADSQPTTPTVEPQNNRVGNG